MHYLKQKTFSVVLGVCNFLQVLSVLPFITDNSSERFSLDDGQWSSSGNLRESDWAEAAYNYVHALDCNNVFFTTGKECRELVTIPKASMVIHIAPKTIVGRYKAVLPDEVLNRKESFDGVLVVDPYPNANFGHLVVVFVIKEENRNTCRTKDGIYIESSGDCLTLALKRRCKNAIKRHGRRRHHARRCEINFLPVVHFTLAGTQELYMEQRYNFLKCWKNKDGFGRCPELRPLNESSELICNPIKENTKRCSTTHEMVHTTCRIFEICDQAVLVSGGWNRQTTGVSHKHNLERFYWMLRQYSFKKRNINIFFANGATGINLPGESPHQVHPAAMKYALRYHIQTLCRSPHCVNSLVLYLNSPAKTDGTMLLWDINSDGLAEDNEKYPLNELKEDLSHCSASYVHVIVDQSYAGQIGDAFRNSHRHRNVIVFASGRDNEYSYDGEYTRQWVKANHTQQCTWQVHRHSKNSIKHSSPEVNEGSRGAVRTTLFGAPCNVIPPFTQRELRHEYLGCQSLPTALWITKLLSQSEYKSKDGSPWRRK
ncbi:LOW QUALITY PROTEIN: uncharacterized protein LOC117343822 [Pecten maximus]|uniref:LOW QUALITY PROTEIN: uncharacterized protein LOC117343822 n=1 Tax=Pecten maximus TaxID=6579 RepID=UPI0014587F51|nr:LOW QUALITY PROTEIN: uncharacterized protein LOC117343822 [Pecten maximus]